MHAQELFDHLMMVVNGIPEANQERWVTGLLALGATQAEADSTIAFTTLAFGRQLLDGVVETFPADYVSMHHAKDDGTFKPLAEVDAFTTAVQQALSVVNVPAFKALALRSSEVDAVNQALHAGADASHLQLSAPIVFELAEKGKGKVWWKFGR
ncbi:MAG: hypothetical protein COA70_09915 [Planctomycetota bacterium]|nr:MAG: hypothetical protein COA70_09915 [Planctomycetota bacterium]